MSYLVFHFSCKRIDKFLNKRKTIPGAPQPSTLHISLEQHSVQSTCACGMLVTLMLCAALLHSYKCEIWKKNILNAISYAPHILLMTEEVNESQFPKFSFQFIWHWSHNNTVVFQFFTIPWDLSMGVLNKSHNFAT